MRIRLLTEDEAKETYITLSSAPRVGDYVYASRWGPAKVTKVCWVEGKEVDLVLYVRFV